MVVDGGDSNGGDGDSDADDNNNEYGSENGKDNGNYNHNDDDLILLRSTITKTANNTDGHGKKAEKK